MGVFFKEPPHSNENCLPEKEIQIKSKQKGIDNYVKVQFFQLKKVMDNLLKI